MSGEGDIRGLGYALNEWFNRFTSITQRSRIPREHVPVLPMRDWHIWSWIEQDVTAPIPIGSSTVVTLFTVPADQRAYLKHIELVRDSGDNTVSMISIVLPAGYRSSSVGSVRLLRLSVAAVDAYWPNRATAVNSEVGGGAIPILLEPASSVEFTPSGAGLAASVFRYRVLMERSKLGRTRAP